MAQQVFTTSGTFTPAAGVTTVDVLIVAGGGGGGRSGSSGAGGGAGGLRYLTGISVAGSIAVTVGAGGAGATASVAGTSGGDSSFGANVATGGGGGGSGGSINGLNGGSGGGGSGSNASATTPGTGIAGQGYDGGLGAAGDGGLNDNMAASGGGGGAGGVGGNAVVSTKGGDGGAGLDYSAIVGTTVGESGWFASGGGGAKRTAVGGTGGVGPLGGGGDGGAGGAGTAGQANTGGGGGGGGSGTNGGTGGSGVVIVLWSGGTPVAPTVGAGADATVQTGTAFTRTATETDGGATISARAWTIVSGPTGVGTTIGTAAALSWTPTAAGTYVLRYSATNSVGTGTDDVQVTVTAAAAGTFSFAITGTPDGDSVPIKVKTAGASSVRLKVGTNSTVTTGVTFTTAQTPDASGYSSFIVSGLSSGAQYWYQAEVGGVLASQIGSFTTDVPLAPRTFRVAFGSCFTTANPTGTAFSNITANAPEAFIHLGDWHYDDDLTTSQAAHQASIENQITSSAPLRQLIRSVPLAYAWSDHDSGNNDWTGGPATWTPSYNLAYREVLPVEGTLPTGGIYRSFGRGRVKFILTDGRSYKSPASATDGASKTMFGTTQEAWIASELADPNYQVKVICLDVPWVYPTTAGDDKWGGYTAAAQRLIDAIQAANAHVLLIHGDSHSLCADDGSSANNRGGLPVAGAAPFGHTTSIKGGPYSAGTWPTSGAIGTEEFQHGLLDVTDTGTAITIRYSGRDTSNVERVTLTKTFAAGTVVDRWNGTTLVRQQTDRWNGTALVQQLVDT